VTLFSYSDYYEIIHNLFTREKNGWLKKRTNFRRQKKKKKDKMFEKDLIPATYIYLYIFDVRKLSKSSENVF